mgnify:CR=1 FL=1
MRTLALPTFFLALAMKAALVEDVEGSSAVLCDPKDPYYALAVEISRVEELPLFHTLERALARDPRFLLWVASPAWLSDKALVHFGLALAARRSAVCPGIITGATLEDARALWRRAAEAHAGKIYAVDGEHPAAGVEHGRILAAGAGAPSGAPLTPAALADALKDADYLTFTGHGGGSYWKLAEGVHFTSADLPPLPPSVIATASCQGVRFDLPSSMALAAVARGAAAYAGFLFSPNEGYLFGEFDGLPLRFTWPGAPVGEVVRLQNRGAVQGFAAFPFYWLVGDPRIALEREAPLTVLRIESARGVRTFHYGEVPAGVYPLRIREGASYGFIEIAGLTDACDDDPLFNSRLQTAVRGSDRLLLVAHPGGHLTIHLHRKPPWYRRLTKPLLDGLDHTLLVIPPGGGDLICLLASGLALIGVILLIRQGALPPAVLLPAFLGGLAVGLSYLLYASLRLEKVSVSTKPASLGSAALIGSALLAACGVVYWIAARTPVRRAAAVAAGAFPSLAPAVVAFAAVFGFNTFLARPRLGAGIYNYALAWMPLAAAACHAAVFLLLAILLERAWKKGRL